MGMKILVVGTGFGRYAMAPVYEALGCEVEVVSPRDGDALGAALARDFDLVSVHSPPFMHHQNVMQALDAGKNVLCDKPFGRNPAEAQAMHDRARDAGVLHFLNCEFRMRPSREKLKSLIAEGAIGTPQHVHFNFFSNGLRGRDHGWLTDAAQGGGWIGAYGSHFLDTLRWLFDSEIADCGGFTRIDTRMRPGKDGTPTASTAEDAFSAWFVMENGGTANIDTCFSGAVPIPTRLIVMGSEGALELVGDTRLLVRRLPKEVPGETLTREERIARSVMAGKADEVIEYPPPTGEAHEPALRPWLTAVLQAIRDNRQIEPDFSDGVKVAEAMADLRAKAVKVG